jgi:membrane associated rhomboid family serine protease
MFIPLHDENPLKTVAFQMVTIVLIILCVGVYYWQFTLSQPLQQQASLAYGMIPSVLLNMKTVSADIHALPSKLTLISYMFLHGSWLHLLGNMLFLWVFGDNIEDSMGHLRFILFYLLCGIAAGVTHGVMEPASDLPLVGASGSIAGLLGAYLMLHPRVKILVLLFSRIPLRLPAYVLILSWILFQIFSVKLADSSVAWWAHIGGFIAGVILIVPMRYKRVPLFDRGVTH